ncbi:RTC4-like domain-containing protein [Daldinia caldariorum]|uniref:RTC4-like domain-containing protein n=1 Tax=Daldinia caldariorum TaxID=326644 RepID=UPI00200741F4|nr:RTC4-like domain-containing protein [Daldinia caldariorum]KAI1469921.1 RTC4-like domain-containing protein [Daldinia caldariorum]
MSNIPASRMNGLRNIREPESITAPPLSSDEEADYQHDSDSDENDSRCKDIRPTTFTTSLSSLQESHLRGHTKEKSKVSSQSKDFPSGSQKETPSSSAGSKRSAQDVASEDISHLLNRYGFPKRNTSTNSKPAITYGTSNSSKPKSSVKRKIQGHPGKKPKQDEASPNPEDTSPLPRKRFKKPETISPEKTKPSNSFIMPQPLPGSSPIQDSKKSNFKHRCVSSDESPPKSKFKIHNLDEESDEIAEAQSGLPPSRSKKLHGSKFKKRKSPRESVVDEYSQRPAFKLHSLDDLDDLDGSDDKVLTVLESKSSDDEADDVNMQSPVITPRCPMCHEVVDAELLAKHSDHGRMNIKKQTAFCRLHKRRTALDSRSRKGYPTINWMTLEKRLDTHQELLKGILEGTRRSYYRGVLQENVEAGKNRTLLKTDASFTPGYYGPRGLRAMTEYIIRNLSSVVRKRAVEDRLVSARGYTGYVQAVLVPELAVRLIMEDMSVSEEDARSIMLESIEVGELLYEDSGDVVVGISDEEEIS